MLVKKYKNNNKKKSKHLEYRIKKNAGWKPAKMRETFYPIRENEHKL